MKAMILAAGRGKRMMPLTKNKPKPLLPVLGKPLLEYHIERLAQSGIQQIIINHCYLGEQIEKYFADGSQFGVKITWSPEQKALETAGGIYQALPLLGNEPFLLVNGDTWTQFQFEKLVNSPHIEALKAKKTLAHLLLVANPSHNSKGDFGLIGNSVVNHAKVQWTYSGIGLYHPDIVIQCQADKAESLTPLLRRASDELKVTGEIYQGPWHDIGTPERLATLEHSLQSASQDSEYS